MQGSLWRQRLGSHRGAPAHRRSRATTTSPIGLPTAVAWSTPSYDGTTPSSSGCSISPPAQSRPLVADGASTSSRAGLPTAGGSRLSRPRIEGRWHIFIAAGERRRYARPAERITEDRDSGLPRYYYGAFDQYLSPTWSPDGNELIFVSNRGHIWGSGGFWRMPARAGRRAAGAALRGDHLEGSARLEPRRQAGGVQLLPRPSVAPALADDRRRRRPASAHLSATATPLPLAGLPTAAGSPTSPTRTATPRSRIVDVPGGGIQRVRAERRIYREPMGRLRAHRDRSRVRPRRPGAGLGRPGRMAGASRPMMPGATPMTASIGASERFEYGYFHTRGSSALTAAGRLAHGGGLPRTGVSRSTAHDVRCCRTRRRRSGSCSTGWSICRQRAGTAPISTCT